MENYPVANRCVGRIMYRWSQMCCTEAMVKLMLKKEQSGPAVRAESGPDC